ncbi:HK97 family phage prohead protease [Xanthobacter autotrophicus]|uniref:HK97 family phage prohead protease n=1 Tax=Xanthobacter autotrophicus TaxID=280 RepID=UPI00372BD86A
MSLLELKGAPKPKALAAVGLELRFDSAKPGLITGYGSVFNVRDTYGDVVAPGAFTASLADWKAKGRLPAMLWQHDSEDPIGRWTEMVEDARGLRCTGELLLSVPKGAEAYEHLKAQTIGGLSIGFRTIERTWNDDTDTRTLNIVDLWEVSLVTFPACDPARIDGVKSAPATIREFEERLREELGFSHREARVIAERGFKASLGPRDEGGGLNDLTASIRAAAKAMKPAA